MLISKTPFPFPKKPISKTDIALALATGIPIVATYIKKR